MCLNCQNLTQKRQGDSTVKAVCGITNELKWLVDGCNNWQKKIELYKCRDGSECALDIKI